jgi:Ca2+-binding RTX toxin-like protein
MGLGRLAAFSILVALGFSAGEGLAATVYVRDNARAVRFQAAPGETNAVVYTVEGPTSVRVADSGAPLVAGAGCVAAGTDVLCEVLDATQFGGRVWLEDGDDSADLSVLVSTIAMGGPGDDVMIGPQQGGGNIQGGPGNDRITGGAGDDLLLGGEGDDDLLGAQGGDWCDGGPGSDTIRGGRHVDMVIGAGGDDQVFGNSGLDYTIATGRNLRLTSTALIGVGNDTLGGIEHATLNGGTGDNVIDARGWGGRTEIWASGGDDEITGGLGPDRIEAGLGNDLIAGRSGLDTLRGGPGADVFFSRDLQPDRLAGGLGRDRARVDALDSTRQIEVFF